MSPSDKSVAASLLTALAFVLAIGLWVTSEKVLTFLIVMLAVIAASIFITWAIMSFWDWVFKNR